MVIDAGKDASVRSFDRWPPDDTLMMKGGCKNNQAKLIYQVNAGW